MQFHIVLILAISCIYATGHEHGDRRRQVAAQPAGTAVTESPADALMRLKLLTYQAKLKAKEDKKAAKATKKAQKDAAFTAYMTAISQGALAAQAPGSAPAGAGPGAAPAAPAPAAVVPPMPMLPAMGLWKKSFLLSQIMAAAAAQNAAIAAAAAAPSSTTIAPPPAVAGTEEDDDEESEEDKTINEIVKRYAPMLRKKFYGVPDRKYENEEESEEDANEEGAEEGENQEVADLDEDEDDDKAHYQSGAFNKFGTGPAGSPNGVGYEDAKVNQAGCSGSHIHICSGTTVYLTNPDDVTNDNPLLQNPELKPVEVEDEEEEEEKVAKPAKYGKKHAHHHRQ